jgi:hypothetical protein
LRARLLFCRGLLRLRRHAEGNGQGRSDGAAQ